MKLKAITLAASLALASSPALADPGDWSSDYFEVMALDDSCVLSATYSTDGRSDIELRVFSRQDDVKILITSPPWSATKGQTYDDFGFFLQEPG